MLSFNSLDIKSPCNFKKKNIATNTVICLSILYNGFISGHLKIDGYFSIFLYLIIEIKFHYFLHLQTAKICDTYLSKLLKDTTTKSENKLNIFLKNRVLILDAVKNYYLSSHGVLN